MESHIIARGTMQTYPTITVPPPVLQLFVLIPTIPKINAMSPKKIDSPTKASFLSIIHFL